MSSFIRTIILAIVLAFGLAQTAEAGSPINMTRAGNALKGYDPVAYFTVGEAVPGLEAHSYEWRHATWLFSSAANRDLFAADPDKFLPAFGGFCAYAVTFGYKIDIDPQAWSIVADRLYLNESPIVRRAWHKDPGYYIALGGEVWDDIKYQ